MTTVASKSRGSSRRPGGGAAAAAEGGGGDGQVIMQATGATTTVAIEKESEVNVGTHRTRTTAEETWRGETGETWQHTELHCISVVSGFFNYQFFPG